MNLPELNKRIKQIIDLKADGNVRKFADLIGISQQKVNRLFNIDTRTGNYPTVPSDILTCITEMFVDIDAKWLLTGSDTEKQSTYPPNSKITGSPDVKCSICIEKDKVIDNQAERIGELKDTVTFLRSQITGFVDNHAKRNCG